MLKLRWPPEEKLCKLLMINNLSRYLEKLIKMENIKMEMVMCNKFKAYS